MTITIDHVRPSEDPEPDRLPSYRGMVAHAVEFAAMCLMNQYDKHGQPAILHACRVMLSGQTDLERVVGVLHDVLEDSPITRDDLESMFGPVVADTVQLLSRDKTKHTYMQYIEALASHPVARVVKKHDLVDNIGRLPLLPLKDAQRLQTRYYTAYAYLLNYRQPEQDGV